MNGNGVLKCNKKSKGLVLLSLCVVLTTMLMLQSCSPGNKKKIDTAIEKVTDLFEEGNEEKIKEGKSSSRIKESTDQERIHDAMEAVQEIDTNDGENDESNAVVFGLETALFIAQYQLKEREGTLDSSSTDEERIKIEFDPDDVVLQGNTLKNKDKLETFIETAGENGDDNESEIRVVKDEGGKGVIIYDLKSNYDKKYDQRWIDVKPDLSDYRPDEDDTQVVFNNAPQQCGYMSKDEEEGYYKLYECRTNWEFRLLPIMDDNNE